MHCHKLNAKLLTALLCEPVMIDASNHSALYAVYSQSYVDSPELASN